MTRPPSQRMCSEVGVDERRLEAKRAKGIDQQLAAPTLVGREQRQDRGREAFDAVRLPSLADTQLHGPLDRERVQRTEKAGGGLAQLETCSLRVEPRPGQLPVDAELRRDARELRNRDRKRRGERGQEPMLRPVRAADLLGARSARRGRSMRRRPR
jgi:hypothetical protein